MIKKDRIPIKGWYISFLIAILLNFDVLNKCSSFNFYINKAEIRSKTSHFCIIIQVNKNNKKNL
jgi:hypothetical protein